jgi:hypothetical protein
MHLASGNLFVVGEVYQKNWVVERFDLTKRTWTAFNPAAPKGSGPSYGACAVTSQGSDVYVLTWTGGIKESPKQTVLLKGTSLGAGKWTVFKTFAEGYYNRPEDLAFDDLNEYLYVVGESSLLTSAGNAPEQWIVRRCDHDGNWQTWTPLTDDPSTQRSFARQICVDSAGLYVAGTAQDIVNTQNWRTIVQKWVQ